VWASGPVWMGAENLAPTGIRFPDRPARSKSLYRPNYRGPIVRRQGIKITKLRTVKIKVIVLKIRWLNQEL